MKTHTAILVAAVLLVVCIIAGMYLYRLEKNRPIAEKVGSMIQLPRDETPTIATVTDMTLLRDRPLFAHAKRGDKVLIYSASKKVVLYRESIGKIIEMGPTAEEQVIAPSSGGLPLTVALYNGSKIKELSVLTRDLISKTYPSITIVEERNTVNGYGKNLVVDLTGSSATTAAQIARLIDGEVTALPPGEDRPQASFVVIIGK